MSRTYSAPLLFGPLGIFHKPNFLISRIILNATCRQFGELVAMRMGIHIWLARRK